MASFSHRTQGAFTLNKHRPTLLTAALLLFLVGFSGCGMKAGPQAAGPVPGAAPISADPLQTPGLDPAHSDHVLPLNVVTQVQHLYAIIFALPPMSRISPVQRRAGFPIP